MHIVQHFAVLAIAGLRVTGCVGSYVTGVKNFGETGKVQLSSGRLGDLPFTFDNQPKWKFAAQKKCEKYWSGAKAEFEQVSKREVHIAWFSCL